MKHLALLVALTLTSTFAFAQDTLPKDHPPMSGMESNGQATNPHALAEAPDNQAREDETLSKGTIRIRVRNEKGEPVADQVVILGILENTVAKGERREQFNKLTDASGDVVFASQRVASGLAYRVRTFRDGAVFFAPPFTLSETRGTNVLIHVFPVVREIDKAQVAFETVLFAELRDDRIQFEEQFTIHNLGSSAWFVEDMQLALPKAATGFSAQPSMSDQAVSQVAGRGISLKGTFTPGEHLLAFRWQLPLHNDSEVNFTVGLPPKVAVVRVGTSVIPGLSLRVSGLEDARAAALQNGGKALMTERLFRPKEKSIESLDVTLAGLPEAGLGRIAGNITYEIAAGVAALVIALALVVWSLVSPKKRDASKSREAILEAITSLEAAHARGDVGPKSFEHLRRELLDQLALTLLVDDTVDRLADVLQSTAKVSKKQKA